jgi:hypothetical protein
MNDRPETLDLDRLAGGEFGVAEAAAALEGKTLDEILATRQISRRDLLEGFEQITPELRAEAVSEVCREDFPSFLSYEMGMDVTPHLLEQWEEVKTGEDCAILAPRDHGKSLTWARGYVIWKTKYDPWVKEVYILGADLESAVENLDKLKELLLTRRSLRSLVPGNWKQGFNNRTSVKLTNGKVIRAKPFISALRGRHPQLIILDDVLNQRNSGTEEGREQIWEQFAAVVIPMKDKGSRERREKGYRPQIIDVGTAIAHDDLHHRLLASEEFRGVKQSAILVDECWEPILDAAGERQALWSDRYTVEDLDAVRKKIGALLFEREYLNKPLADEMAIFPRSLFEPLLDEDLSYVSAYDGTHHAFLGADFSIPGSQDGDYTVTFVLEFNPERKLYTPLNFWRKRAESVSEQLRMIEYMVQAYRVTKGYLEADVFQRIYAAEFAAKTNLPLEGHRVGGSKQSYISGILGLRPLFEVGAWRFPYKTDRDKQMTDQLIREFSGIVQRKGKLGNEAGHDDIPLALWHAWVCAMDLVSGPGWQTEWKW